MVPRLRVGHAVVGHNPRARQTIRRMLHSVKLRRTSPELWADGPFYMLLALAALITASLIAVIVNLWPLYAHEVMNLCLRSWSVLTAHLPAVGALVLPIGFGIMVGLGIWTCLRQMLSTRRFTQAIRDGRDPIPPLLQHLAHDLDIADRIDVIWDERAYAFCYGLWRPRICLSTELLALLDIDELRALLIHERHHLRRRDPLRKLVTQTLVRALSVFPIVDDLAYHCRLTQEVAADDAAVRDSGSPAPLAAALFKLWTANHPSPSSDAAVGAFSITEARIAYLLHGHRALSRSPWPRVVTTWLLIAGIALAGFLGWMVMHEINIGSVECLGTLPWPR